MPSVLLVIKALALSAIFGIWLGFDDRRSLHSLELTTGLLLLVGAAVLQVP